jgi:hypothetical protein
MPPYRDHRVTIAAVICPSSLQAQSLGAEGNHALVKALEHLAGFEVGRARDS